FITPASKVRRKRLYRIGNLVYGHPNAITGPLILGHILKDAGHDVSVYEELYADVDYSKLLDA
ncbi:MAG TPA: B12-binding domain-containing radical SAM protein, partial [Ruminococcaceae bacterium]|nr:B12-binding domain-containing radical SAM protein [Oscillospiraceae bacterium]